MKLARNAIILSVLLVIIAGAFILLSVFDKKEANNTDSGTNQDESSKIMALNRDDMVEVTIENGDVKYVLKHSGDKYEVTYPAGTRFDGTTVNTTFNNLSALPADKVFKDDTKDLSKYGLDKPATVTIKLKDGSEKVLDIGKVTPTKDGVYAKLRDNDKIYVITPYYVDTIKVDDVYFDDRSLFAPKKEDLFEIGAQRDGKLVYTLSLEADKWGISSPVSGNVNADKVERILNYFSTLKASNFISKASTDLSVYEFDKPSYAFEVKAKTGSIKLLLGKEKEKDNEIYGMIEGRKGVFTLSLPTLGYFLDMPLSDLLDRLVYCADIKEVTDLKVIMDGNTTSCTVKLDPNNNKDLDKFTVDGKDASGKDKNGDFLFRSYYKSLISLTFSDIDVEARPQGTPDVTIIYNLNKAPGTVKVELIPANDTSYHAVINGKYTGKLVPKKSLDDKEGIRDSYKILMDSLNKK